MAASVQVIPGNKFKLLMGSDAIGGGRSHTLRVGRGIEDVTNDLSANWHQGVYASREWGMDAETIWIDDSLALSGAGATLTIGGVAIKGRVSLGWNLTTAFNNVVNSTTGLQRAITTERRRGEVTVQGDYYDPLGTGADALDDVLDEVNGATSLGLACVLTVGGLVFTFTAKVSGATVGKSLPEVVKNGLTLVSDGAITINDGGETDFGLLSLYEAVIEAPSDQVTSFALVMKTATVGNTQYSGSAVPVGLNLTVPIEGPVTLAATFEGTGALSRTATA